MKTEEQHLGSRSMEGRSANGGMIDDGRNLENLFDSNPNGCFAPSAGSPPREHSPSKGNGYLKTLGTLRLSSGEAVLIVDSCDDCAPEETETLFEKVVSEKREDNDYLGLTGAEKKPRVLKRKRASFLDISDNENDGDNIEPSGSLVNHCSVVAASSTINDYEKQSDPSSCDHLILRQSEETIGAEEKSQENFQSLEEVSDGDDSSGSSYSDSEDDYQSLCNLMPKAKARKLSKYVMTTNARLQKALCERQLKECEEKVLKLQDEVSDLCGKVQAAESNHDLHACELIKARGKVEDLKRELEAEKNVCEEKVLKLQDEVSGLRGKVQAVESHCDLHVSELIKARREVKGLKRELEAEKNVCEEKLLKLRDEVSSLHGKLQASESDGDFHASKLNKERGRKREREKRRRERRIREREEEGGGGWGVCIGSGSDFVFVFL